MKMIMCSLLSKLSLRHKSEVYPYGSKHPNDLLKIQWVFVILLSLLVIRNFSRGTCSSVEMLKVYMAKERLGTPVLVKLHAGPVLGGLGHHYTVYCI